MTAKQQALERIAQDRASFVRLFAACAALAGRTEVQAESAALAEQIVLEVSVHSRSMREHIYPALAQALPPAAVERSLVEWGAVEHLLAELAHAKGQRFDALIDVLADAIGRLSARETQELFGPRSRVAIDWPALAQRFERSAERGMKAAARALGREVNDDEEADPVGRPA
jgi:hypothetical protein